MHRGHPDAGAVRLGQPLIPVLAGGHLLVTGGAGFIGSAYVRNLLLRRDGTRVTVLDKLTVSGNRANLDPVVEDPELAERFRFVEGDIADAEAVRELVATADAVVNFAAESHVDRSIIDAEASLRTGVIGVHVLLEAIRREAGRAEAGERAGAPRLVQVSTDEVYGSVSEGRSSESDALAPRSPYAVAKAAGDLLAHAYAVTYGTDVVVTRGSNTYGPFQHPEKLIPLFVTNAIDDLPMPLYGDGLQERDWLHVDDHAEAVDHVLRRGATGEVYNVVGDTHLTNRDLTRRLLDELGKPWSLVRTVEDRPGHDRRYAMDGARLAALGWQPRVPFPAGLAATVDWYRTHEAWWRDAHRLDLLDANETHKRTLTVNDKKLRITIPAGIENGQTIKIAGHGGPGINGGPNGDLYIKFMIANHPKFRRLGNDLYTTVNLDLYTAVLGGEITINILSGKVKLKVKPETQNGSKVKLKGKGFPVYKSKDQFGDLYVTFMIKIPINLTAKQKELFAQLANSQ